MWLLYSALRGFSPGQLSVFTHSCHRSDWDCVCVRVFVLGWGDMGGGDQVSGVRFSPLFCFLIIYSIYSLTSDPFAAAGLHCHQTGCQLH